MPSDILLIPICLNSSNFSSLTVSGFASSVISEFSVILKHSKINLISEPFKSEGVPPPKYKVFIGSFLYRCLIYFKSASR